MYPSTNVAVRKSLGPNVDSWQEEADAVRAARRGASGLDLGRAKPLFQTTGKLQTFGKLLSLQGERSTRPRRSHGSRGTQRLVLIVRSFLHLGPTGDRAE